MTSYFSKMLLGDLPVHTGKGRPITFSHADIDIRLITGSKRKRILLYLQLVGVPATAKEIADGIGRDSAWVHRLLRNLVASGEINAIKLEGSVTEYTLPYPAVKQAA